MLTELLLAGVASASVGLKSAANDNFFVKDGFGSLHESSIDSKYLEDIYDLNDNNYLSYEDNSNFWNKDFEKEKNSVANDTFYNAQVVSPFFKGDDEYINYDGFSNHIVGDFATKQNVGDVDFYRFYLYGDAEIELTYDGPQDIDLMMYQIEGSTGAFRNKTGPDLDNETTHTKAITGSFKAGAYCFDVTGKASHNGIDYQINIKATYIKDVNYSIGEQRSYEKGGLIWVSDFDPLDMPCFEQDTKEVSLTKGYYDVTMESSLANKKILHSSLYLWSPQAKNLGYQIVKGLYDSTSVLLEQYKAQKAYYEDLAVYAEMFDGMLRFTVNFFFFMIGLGGTEIMEEIAFYVLGEVAGVALDQLSLEAYVRSLIPEKEIEDTQEILSHLTFLLGALSMATHTTDDVVVNLTSYYKLTYDESTSKLLYKREYDINPEATVYEPDDDESTEELEPDTVFATQPNSWMNGRIYELKYMNDYHDARKHIMHHYEAPEVTNGKQLTKRTGGQTGHLNRGGFDWFYFRASVDGTYQFFSSGDHPTYDTYAGELFNAPVPGRSTSGMIAYDDDKGFTGHFCLTYYMLEDEIVWIRVHGKNWATKDQSYSMNVEHVDGWNDLILDETKPYDDFDRSVCTFEHDSTRWLSMEFATPGNKIIQNYSNDSNAVMKVYDFRGNFVTSTTNQQGGYAGNGFLCFNAVPNEVYLLRITVPSYAKTTKTLKITATSVGEKYSTIFDLDRFTDNGDTYGYELSYGNANMAIFVPTKNANYQFFGEDETIIDVYDTYTGKRMNQDFVKDFDKTDGNYYEMPVDQGRAVTYLEKAHEYLVLTYTTDSECEFDDFCLDVDLLSNGYYCISEYATPITISLTQGYYEMQNVLYASSSAATTKDNWFRFENSGYRIFTLFGNCNNLKLELYDSNNNLLKSDDTSKGPTTNSANYLCCYVEANKNYRVRIVDTKFQSWNTTVKLTITSVAEYKEKFTDMEKLTSGDCCWYNTISGWNRNEVGCVCVGYFVPQKNGYYRICMTDPYPKSLKVSVIDTASGSYIVKDVDYSGGEGYGDQGCLLKNLFYGKSYYIVYTQADLTQVYGDPLNLCIDYVGYIANTSNSYVAIQYQGNQTTEYVNFVYTAPKTGYICFDTNVNGNASAVSFSASIYRKTDYKSFESEYICRKITKNNKDAIIVHLTKGQMYVVSLFKNGYTANSGYVYCYFKDTSNYNETESVNIDSYSDDKRYAERTCYLYGSQTMTYDITHETGGQMLLQTFGSLDTILELRTSSGSFLTRDDNNGYKNNALIKYYLSPNTTYKLTVRLKNSGDGGGIKTTITPVNNSCYTYYDNLRTVYATNNAIPPISFSLQYNKSDIVRFIPKTSGYYTFTLRSDDVDPYLHVIDPASYSPKVNKKDFADDGEGTNSLISRRHLNAGHEYYIVASAYDPADEYGNASLSIVKG